MQLKRDQYYYIISVERGEVNGKSMDITFDWASTKEAEHALDEVYIFEPKLVITSIDCTDTAIAKQGRLCGVQIYVQWHDVLIIMILQHI